MSVDQQRLAELARRHRVALVVRFGSTVKGTAHSGSDVDLGILYDRMPASLDDELSLEADLQSLRPGIPVDVTVLNRADPLLLKQVADSAHLECGTPQRFDAFMRYAFKRYHDHRPFFEMEQRYLDRIIEGRQA